VIIIQGVPSISTTFENAITFLFEELARRFYVHWIALED
jgi:hypothetical protein